jgi:tetratricopeptide (TPR) repeat protein
MAGYHLGKSDGGLGILVASILIAMTIGTQAIADLRVPITNDTAATPDLSVKTPPNLQDIDGYMQQAAIDYQSGKTLGAIANYTQAIQLDPQLAIAYNNRAIAKIVMKDYRGALADYGEVIRLQPDKALSYNNRAVLRQQLGDCRGAVVDLLTAAKLFKQQGDLLGYRRTLVNLRHFEKLLKN